MEILIGIKNNMRKTGLLLFDHPYSKFINFAQCFLISGIVFVAFLTPLWFFIFEAETFIEYIESTMPICATLFNMMTYYTLLWQRKKIFKLIIEYQSMIARRKFCFELLTHKYF